jgi:hypothetical protein
VNNIVETGFIENVLKVLLWRTNVKNSQYLSTAEAAQMIGVTKTTLKSWLRTEKVPEPERDPANGYRLWTLVEVNEIRQKLREEGK